MLDSAAEPDNCINFGNRARALPLLLGLCLIGLAACDSQKKAEGPTISQVAVQKAAMTQDAEEGSGTGEIKPRIESELSFKVSGQVNARYVGVGDHVKTGQILATLDDTEQRADVASARASVDSQEASLRIAQSVLKRREALTATGALSRQQLDSAVQEFQSAENDLAAAKASLATAEEALGQTVLRADADGAITARNIETGQVVQPSSTAFTLAQDGALDAVFNVQENVLSARDVAPTIEISLLSRPSIRAKANIREVSPALDRTLGTVRVKLSIENPPPEMTLGSTIVAHVRFATYERVKIPWQSLYSLDGQPAVWVVDPTSMQTTLKTVSVERYDATQVVLAKGLKPGDIFVVDGGQFLRNEEKVAITGEAVQ
ncbi:RND family efflux transporter MFP subunit [Rhizobium sp. SG_E_25_P2]|jgi:membrane fusion protein, multidrug efflux system|uniref:efflux RND transporter periplasmic adaptor subunit n=1 Tax=Rhizobium sp. SG_E_25_P2 TaxID=2879942 RepID=UPI00247367A6|nr:efflux RND transporter periplasmic adaptor subunit [Rhizobium sp. SG_E_25_P2]MDH6267412.1 RND family efflux transporter MFP subunit [Rhizobium sp. SG_E_25_P2]